MKKLLLSILALTLLAPAVQAQSGTADLMAFGMPAALAERLGGLALPVTADAADSQYRTFVGGGAFELAGARGSGIRVSGNEASGITGGVHIYGGNTTTGHINNRLNNASAFWRIQDASGNAASFWQAGTYTTNAAGDNATDVGGFVARRARGTMTLPTATQSGDILINIGARGYGATDWEGSSSSLIQATATENYTDSARGSNMTFLTTATGGTTRSVVLTLDQDKSAAFTGTILGTATSTLGWTIKAGANTSCATTCTAAAVFGFNTDVTPVLVGPTDAAADLCICAGAT